MRGVKQHSVCFSRTGGGQHATFERPNTKDRREQVLRNFGKNQTGEQGLRRASMGTVRPSTSISRARARQHCRRCPVAGADALPRGGRGGGQQRRYRQRGQLQLHAARAHAHGSTPPCDNTKGYSSTDLAMGFANVRAGTNTKGYSSTYLAMGFANVRAGTQKRRGPCTRSRARSYLQQTRNGARPRAKPLGECM